MKLDNKGLSIIELLLGLVLFSIIALAVTGFIYTGTKTCKVAESEIELQEEAQLVSNQIINLTVEGNSVSMKEDTATGDFVYYIYKTNRNSNVTESEYILYFKKSSHKVYFYNLDLTTEDSVKTTIQNEISGTAEVTVGQLLGEYVEDFNVAVEDNKKVTFKVTYKYGETSKVFQSSDYVVLRNKYIGATTPIV